MADSKKRILIIEDEMPLRGALREFLIREGFAVLEAENGEKGLEIATREHPDLILLDIVMPHMDGMTMLSFLRKDAWGKTVPVIILTNLSTTDEKRNSDITELLPSFYLIKSDWKLEDLLEKIQECLV
ncbi:response regulator [Candidatus Campbellbacteria bacterium]|nr:MAG: response regulator [Candidatus Campbellbacteria bacterium]